MDKGANRQAKFTAQIARASLNSTADFLLISSSSFAWLLSHLRRCWLCTRAPHPRLFSNIVPSSICWCLRTMLENGSTAHQNNHETYCAFPQHFLFPHRKKGCSRFLLHSKSPFVCHTLHTRGKTPDSFNELPAHYTFVPSL